MNQVVVAPPWTVVRAAILAGLAVLMLVLVGAARPASVVSETTWGGPSSEVTNGVAAAGDGSTYLTGFTTSFDPFGQQQLFLVKHAADGTIAWQQTWEGPAQFGNDEGTDVAVAADGSVYVTGATFGDALLLKFTSTGTLLWQLRWDGGASERGEALAVAGDGSIYVVGGTSSFGDSLFVLRFSPAGTLISQQIFGPASGDGVAVAADGSVYVAGTAPRPNASFEFDVVLLKLDSTGSLVWDRAYSGLEIADARGGVTVAPDRSVYVGGAIQGSTRKVVVDALLLKFASDGSLVFDRGWGGRSGDVGNGVAARSDSSAVLVGDTNSFGAGSDDAFALQVSGEGRGLDANTWGGTDIDHGDDAVVASDGALVVGATTGNPPPYKFAGASRKTYRVRGTASDSTIAPVAGMGTVADAAGTVAAATGTTPGAGGFDAAVLQIAL
jgi:sugar lactone lactonase YvrE